MQRTMHPLLSTARRVQGDTSVDTTSDAQHKPSQDEATEAVFGKLFLPSLQSHYGTACMQSTAAAKPVDAFLDPPQGVRGGSSRAPQAAACPTRRNSWLTGRWTLPTRKRKITVT
jgi:aminoglycoside/choline kinase family phosphotransferase